MGAFIWPELFLLRGAGAGLIRHRPAAVLSLAERLADPCCLIGTGSLLTRAFYQRGETDWEHRAVRRPARRGPRETIAPLAEGTPDPLMKEMGS